MRQSSLVGFAKWDIAKDTVSPAFVGSYDEGENLIAAKYDSAVSPSLSPPSCTMYLPGTALDGACGQFACHTIGVE